MSQSLDGLFSREHPRRGACFVCGEPTEAVVTAEIRERKGKTFGRRLTRSVSLCGECAVRKYDMLIEELGSPRFNA